MNARTLYLIGILLMVLLTSCRRQQAAQQPSVREVNTPTPISTPLPAIPTLVPVGQSEDSPLQMVIRPFEPVAAARNVAARFQSALEDMSGLFVEVVLVERTAEALAALCDSSSGQVSVAWLDGIGYMAATAQNCGQPALQVERGRGRDATIGQAGQLIANRDLGISAVSQLSGDNFCRLGYEDFYSWLVPSLLLEANGVNSLSDLDTIMDYEELPELLQAVADGDCDATAIPEGALDEESDEVRDEIDVVETTVPFPHAILMYPIEVSLGTRLTLTDALVAMAQDDDNADLMRTFLGQDALERADADDYIEFRNFMNSTGLNFAQLGG
jgi:ABC-type phosphate/phosphonate transport system substrate-binding protein